MKNVFQLSAGVDVEDSGAAADAGAVVEAWRRVPSWYGVREGLVTIDWVWVLIEGMDFVVRAAHRRCDRVAAEENWQLAPLVTAAWSFRRRAPRALSRAAVFAGVNISSGITAGGTTVH